MDIDVLLPFEKKYLSLYDIEVNGVPVYTVLREETRDLLLGVESKTNSITVRKGRVYLKRIIDGFVKIRRFRNAKTLIFSSSVYRRDYGRNLAVEYLLDHFSDAVIFEWPCREDAFDGAYFKDEIRNIYCPIDYIVILYKLYCLLHRKEWVDIENKCRKRVEEIFINDVNRPENEERAVEMLIREIPKSYVTTLFWQRVFKRTFRKYCNIECAIDFFGAGRENIFPVLSGNVEKIELQHGIIGRDHRGYIYPSEIKKSRKDFFNRRILVYGEATKKLLTEQSIFNDTRIEVIGNPRIIKYKQSFSEQCENRKYILFASQPYIQLIDGVGYYDAMIQTLQRIQMQLNQDKNWREYRLVIKLHPREHNDVRNLYKEKLPECEVFDNSSPLYDLLCKSFLQLVLNSTTLYEAALFDTPTIVIPFAISLDSELAYGFKVREYNGSLPNDLLDADEYAKYLDYLKDKTRLYM